MSDETNTTATDATATNTTGGGGDAAPAADLRPMTRFKAWQLRGHIIERHWILMLLDQYMEPGAMAQVREGLAAQNLRFDAAAETAVRALLTALRQQVEHGNVYPRDPELVFREYNVEDSAVPGAHRILLTAREEAASDPSEQADGAAAAVK